MKLIQPSFFDSNRSRLTDSLEITLASLNTYARAYDHWAIAYSGGKDSTALVSAVVHLLETRQMKLRPKTLTVLYADTRMELPPLHRTAMNILEELRGRGVKTQIVLPEMDQRFFVYMLGRGVPPPSNTFRWCTGQLKVNPMLEALSSLRDQYGEKFLMLTGVRLGESAARDQRISLSCGKNGAECGQGWFQEETPESVADTLAPLLHWRVCHVWDWLSFHTAVHGFSTHHVASVYGGDEAEEINARTGCAGCNLASRDLALETILKKPDWAHLKPLMELRPLYAALKSPTNRLRKDGSETRKDGTLVKNPCRMGPLTFEARRWGLERVKSIQERAGVDLINAEEEARIVELVDSGTWPNGWDGSEPLASVPFENVNPDGSSQPIMRALLGS